MLSLPTLSWILGFAGFILDEIMTSYPTIMTLGGLLGYVLWVVGLGRSVLKKGIYPLKWYFFPGLKIDYAIDAKNLSKFGIVVCLHAIFSVTLFFVSWGLLTDGMLEPYYELPGFFQYVHNLLFGSTWYGGYAPHAIFVLIRSTMPNALARFVFFSIAFSTPVVFYLFYARSSYLGDSEKKSGNSDKHREATSTRAD